MILHPALSAAPTATTFVAEPSKLKFPPKQEPNDKAHQSAFTPATPAKLGVIILIIFENVAALATFPITEVKRADIHIVDRTAPPKWPSVTVIILSPINLIISRFSIPLIIINKPMKKNKVSHSTPSNISLGLFFASNDKHTAPDNAIIASPLSTKLFKINPIITKENITIDCFKSFISFNDLLESNSMILAFNSFDTFIFLAYIK